jgi:SNF2 family DNA or RNA helicase
MDKHSFISPPMNHQLIGLRKAWKKKEYALFWEMGTGKTFTAINLAAARFNADQIDSLLVVCPTPIKSVWKSEILKWSPIPASVDVIEAGRKALSLGEPSKLEVLVVGVESLSNGKASKLASEFVATRNPMIVCDESSKLKNPNATRTKKAVQLANQCEYKIIMTGTPITQGMEDLYSQFLFLDRNIIGVKNYFMFKRTYCIMGGFEGRKILGYMNEDELLARLAPFTDVVKKADVLDLPEKVYERVSVEPTKEQLALIKALKEKFEAEQGGEVLSVRTILERLTRFQQILGGNFPYAELDSRGERVYRTSPVEGKNPKLEALMDLIQGISHETKVIIWARFVPEIEAIKEQLDSYAPGKVRTFYGKDTADERNQTTEDFQNGEVRFIVANPSVGGMGQTWTAATLVIYFSNSFSYENRMQSEDRVHRKGQYKSVTYVDIEMAHEYDSMVLSAIKHKGGVAKYIDSNMGSPEKPGKFYNSF